MDFLVHYYCSIHQSPIIICCPEYLISRPSVSCSKCRGIGRTRDYYQRGGWGRNNIILINYPTMTGNHFKMQQKFHHGRGQGSQSPLPSPPRILRLILTMTGGGVPSPDNVPVSQFSPATLIGMLSMTEFKFKFRSPVHRPWLPLLRYSSTWWLHGDNGGP